MTHSFNRVCGLAAVAVATVLVFPAAQAQTFGASESAKPSRPAAKTVTVEQAHALKDDADVVLGGRIVAKLRDDHYRFEDASGSIEVEIDDDDWNGVTTTPEQTVRIIGEVDKDRRSTTIDVDRVERR